MDINTWVAVFAAAFFIAGYIFTGICCFLFAK